MNQALPFQRNEPYAKLPPMARRILQNIPYRQSYLSTHEFRRGAKEGKMLAQNLVCPNNVIGDLPSALVSSVR